jgi:phenylacetic acid degradation operon negative regulatory protein
MRSTRNADLLERPLGARSLVASLLLRSEPPRMPAARLVQWCGLFGVAEGTARVALTRMVDRGELRADNGTYALAGRVGSRRVAQDWSLAPKLDRWDGSWRLAIVGGGARSAADRQALRDAMRLVRCAQLREGVWTRPANLPRAAAADDAWDVVDAQCTWWSAHPDDDPVQLAESLFAVRRWATRADRLHARLLDATRELAGGHDRALAGAFEIGAASVAHIRRDPLLPEELGAGAAAGWALRAAYREYEGGFTTALHAWFRAHA